MTFPRPCSPDSPSTWQSFLDATFDPKKKWGTCFRGMGQPPTRQKAVNSLRMWTAGWPQSPLPALNTQRCGNTQKLSAGLSPNMSWGGASTVEREEVAYLLRLLPQGVASVPAWRKDKVGDH